MVNTLVTQPEKTKAGSSKLKRLQRKLAKEPDSFDNNMQLGVFHFQKGEITKAITYLEIASNIKNDHTELLFILANAHKVLNNVTKSETYFKKALLLEPDNFEFLYNYGLLLHSLSRLNEATEIFEKAIKLQPDNYELLNDIGVLCYLQQNFKEALHFFDETIKIKPDYILATINIGYTYLALNDFINTGKIIKQLYHNNHNNPDVIELKNKAEHVFKIGNLHGKQT